jgi:hypothetical protein
VEAPVTLRCWPVLPIAGRKPCVTQEWNPPGHLGVDIAFPRRPGDPPERADDPRSAAGRFHVPGDGLVVAVAAGRVRYAAKHENGFRVRLEHADTGSDSIYLHLADLRVAAGDVVPVGQLLGVMGGDPSPADPRHFLHLHFELRNRSDNQPFNPEPYLARWPILCADKVPG